MGMASAFLESDLCMNKMDTVPQNCMCKEKPFLGTPREALGLGSLCVRPRPGALCEGLRPVTDTPLT